MNMTHQDKDPNYSLEKYSSAITLGDMEIFVFPELLYSLVLANIMSPRIWAWLEEDWAQKIQGKSSNRRVQRLKQYIMDAYDFNLDLDTWGLTTKEREMERFSSIIDPEILKRSNALFGYEGDKYYFDLDIRKHFGLDNYTDDIIPYWKTETIEAMDAFRHKEGYSMGAGECVSLSTLYAAAMFIVGGVALEDILLLATPLHSQNFVNLGEGVITNNRRIVTKKMWFNGTEISWKAQRAIRNEKITIVANNTGYIHTMYPEATIDPASYQKNIDKLSEYLTVKIDMEILSNFLRQHSELQKCFQIRQDRHGGHRYIEAEKVYAYEHGSSYRVNDDTRDKLLDEIDGFEFYTCPIQGRIVLNTFEDFFKQNPDLDLNDPKDLAILMDAFSCTNAKARNVGQLLVEFCHIEPRFPENRTFVPSPKIELKAEWGREKIIETLEGMRETNPVVDLAFYAYRDLTKTDWKPFLKAALERNPVVIDALRKVSESDAVEKICALPSHSVYDENRLAQPDEVWNFQTGDGAEKAITLANLLKHRHPERPVTLSFTGDKVKVAWDNQEQILDSIKGLHQELEL
ncbi:hypothetical protein P3T73_07465 [Kiritimatiellota bacterium B12222]|nr:hypothetical protein P3T73_07465 [Kiritimatiellota bacterium B12222]